MNEKKARQQNSPMRIGWINTRSGELKPDLSRTILFECQSTGSCCDKLDIQLTDLDIYRIEERGYELDQFIEELTPQVIIPTDSQAKPVKYYRIKRRPYDRRCVFMEDNLCRYIITNHMHAESFHSS